MRFSRPWRVDYVNNPRRREPDFASTAGLVAACATRVCQPAPARISVCTMSVLANRV